MLRALPIAGLAATLLSSACAATQTPAEATADDVQADAQTEAEAEPPPAQTEIGGIAVGTTAPDFELTGADGTSVSLAALRQSGPVVVVFYRGDWCPICRKQLSELAEAKPKFEAKKAALVAVSVDPVATNAALADKVDANFPLLADPDLATIRAYDVEHTGEDIARPSTYVIDTEGRVVWAWVGERAGDRPDLEHILAAIP